MLGGMTSCPVVRLYLCVVGRVLCSVVERGTDVVYLSLTTMSTTQR